MFYREVPALQGGGGGMGEKEMMILLQQRKIAALDEANNRLVGIERHLGSDRCSPSLSSRYTSSPSLGRR